MKPPMPGCKSWRKKCEHCHGLVCYYFSNPYYPYYPYHLSIQENMNFRKYYAFSVFGTFTEFCYFCILASMLMEGPLLVRVIFFIFYI